MDHLTSTSLATSAADTADMGSFDADYAEAEVVPYSEAWESPFRITAEAWASAIKAFGIDVNAPTGRAPKRVRSDKARPAKAVESADGGVETVWTIVLRELGRLGVHLGDGRYALWCINDAAHSTPEGSAENARGSCVLLPPVEDSPHGLPHCSHAHCENLRVDDWRAIVPSEMWARALDSLGHTSNNGIVVAGGAPNAPAGGGRSGKPEEPPERPLIVVQRRVGPTIERTPVPELARAGLDALAGTPWGERLFTVDGSNPPQLVHVIPPDVDSSGSPDHSPRARVVITSKSVLRGWLSGAARWATDGAGRSGRELHEADPPEAVVAFTLEACDGMRPLRGLLEAPAMRADGSIVSEPGYDPVTRLFAAFDGDQAREAIGTIPEHPTAQDAAEAAARVLSLVVDFPFETEAHRVMWLAGVVTMLAREAFHGPAPLFFARANTQGSGKSLLAEIAHIIVTGERPSMIGWSGNDEEFEKLVTAEAIAGAACIVIDNVTGLMRSATLDRILTSGKHRARILGGNTRFDGPLRAVWWASGNNVETSSDLGRRTAPIELVAREERPDQRTGFSADEGGETGTAALRRKARRERWQHVADVLTILRAWHCAGRPSGNLPAWGSFESWSHVVRGSLVFAGLTDPGAAREEFRDAAATDAGVLRGLLAGWHEATRGGLLSPSGETIARAIKRLLSADPSDSSGNALREALESASGESIAHIRGEVASRLGKLMRSHRRRVARTQYGSLLFDVAGESGGSVRWRVCPAGGEQSPEARGDKGVRGDNSYPMTRVQKEPHVYAPYSGSDHPPYSPHPPSPSDHPSDASSDLSDCGGFPDVDAEASAERAAIRGECEL